MSDEDPTPKIETAKAPEIPNEEELSPEGEEILQELEDLPAAQALAVLLEEANRRLTESGMTLAATRSEKCKLEAMLAKSECRNCNGTGMLPGIDAHGGPTGVSCSVCEGNGGFFEAGDPLPELRVLQAVVHEVDEMKRCPLCVYRPRPGESQLQAHHPYCPVGKLDLGLYRE